MMGARKISDGTGIDEDVTTEILKTGMSFKVAVDIAYSDLAQILGEPSAMLAGKSDAEWLVMTGKGLACVYNWKDGPNWLGGMGRPLEKITEWHIGAHSMMAARAALGIIEGRVRTG